MDATCKKCGNKLKNTKSEKLSEDSKYTVIKCRVCKTKLYFDENLNYVKNFK